MSLKNSSDTIGNRNRDLPTCSAVPQPIALLRARSDKCARMIFGPNGEGAIRDWKKLHNGYISVRERINMECGCSRAPSVPPSLHSLRTSVPVRQQDHNSCRWHDIHSTNDSLQVLGGRYVGVIGARQTAGGICDHSFLDPT